MVVVDCGAISPTLIESELFGHEKGAFTGAHARKPGRLAQADGATVFLDEIGELPLDLQSKLLRFVQEKQFTPGGQRRRRAGSTCASSPPRTSTCGPGWPRAGSARTSSTA